MSEVKLPEHYFPLPGETSMSLSVVNDIIISRPSLDIESGHIYNPVKPLKMYEIRVLSCCIQYICIDVGL